MSLAVFWRTLKDGRGTLVALSVGIAVFCGLLAALYPRFHDQAALEMRLMPSFIRALMSAVPLDRPEGYVSWAFSHPIWIALASAWPIASAGGAIAGAVERGTLGLVLAAPVSRQRYFAARAAAMVVGEGIVLACAHLTMLVGFYAIGHPPGGGPGAVGLVFLQAWLVYSTLGAIVLLASAAASDAGPIYALGIGVVVTSIVVTLLTSLWVQLQGLRPLSLFSYFHPYDLLRGAALPPSMWLVPLIIAIVAYAGAWFAFERRDLAI